MTSISSRTRFLFSLILLGYCAWILSLPVFPSQDGPAHLYYGGVLSQILSGHQVFSGQYEVTHWVPPYALQNYFLALLLRWLSPLLAEKIIACVCVLLTGYGFRFFANRLGPSGDLVALFALPFLLHVYLFLGFYNYCMAVGLAFFAMGTWLQGKWPPWRRRVAFLALVLLTMLSHPVPVLFVLAFCGGALVLGWLLRNSSTSEVPIPQFADALTLGFASTTLLYIGRFVDRSTGSPLGATLAALRHGDVAWLRLLLFVRMLIVSPVTSAVYRYFLVAIVLLFLVAACWQNGKDLARRRFTAAQLSLAGGLLIAAWLPLFPSVVNGSGFLFADRLTIVSVLLIIAAAARLDLSAGSRLASAGGALCGIAALLALEMVLGPVGRFLSLPNHPVVQTAENTWIVNIMNGPANLTFNPCTTAGVRILQQEQRAWLNNPPWLGLSITMLRAKGPAADFGQHLRTDSKLAIVVVHCGGSDDGITGQLEAKFPGRWNVSKERWANILRPAH
jgi:hypothetical protein